MFFGGTPNRLVLCVSVFAVSAVADIASAESNALHQCGVPKITVAADDANTARTVCTLASETDTRLLSLGLQLSEPIQIEITSALEAPQDVCVALYNPQRKKIQVLPLECLGDQHGRAITFPGMDAETYFESLIIHEMVHAYIDQTPKGPFLTTLAQEYLAYAIQIDALPESIRDVVIAKAAIEELVNFRDIRKSTLDQSPVRFSVLSWLHFKEAGGDAVMVNRVVEDRVLLFRLAR